MKKLLFLFVSIILSFTSAKTAFAEILTGECGSGGSVTYLFDTETGILTISGTGEMSNMNYSPRLRPWGTSVKKVIIENGVVSIGQYTFNDCSDLTSVTIGNSVMTIGNYAFHMCI